MAARMIEIVHGGIADILPYCEENEFDAVLCDPPYGLRFMGKKWDYDVPSAELWAEIVRVIKPGAPVLAFGGTRTYHRLVCGMEDGGLEIRDTIAWIYGSGMPKSQNISIALDKAQGLKPKIVGTRILSGNAGISTKDKGGTYGVGVGSAGNVECPVYGPAIELAKEWDGYGTNLKPALEPICLARKPLDGTMANNVWGYRVGGLNIDGTRIGRDPGDVSGWSKTGSKASENIAMSGANYARAPKPDAPGRWPANVILDEESGAVMDAQSGNRPGMSGGGKHRADYPGGMFGGIDSTDTARGDNGGASRFFYCPKANRKERELGCEHLPAKKGFEAVDRKEGSAGLNGRAGAGAQIGKVHNYHPTVKPLDLDRYLATLIMPPKAGKILVPWAGSGSEMIGAYLAGWRDIVGIELEEDYCKIARARLDYWCKAE